MNETLKPCPFCGNQVDYENFGFGVNAIFECKSCGVKFIFPYGKTITGLDAAKAWNRRVNNA